jgi:hypothetical protein
MLILRENLLFHEFATQSPMYAYSRDIQGEPKILVNGWSKDGSSAR